MIKRKNLAIAAGGVIVLVIILVWLLSAEKPQEGLKVEQLSTKELAGSTVEERLALHNIDVANARITKIEDVALLQQKYSGIFKDAKNGHYLVELPDAIMVYDFEHDALVARFDVVRMEVG